MRSFLERKLGGVRWHVSQQREWLRDAGHVITWLTYLPGPGPRLMSWLRKRWVLFRNPGARIEFGADVYLGPGFSLHMPKGGTFITGPRVEFRRNFRAELGNGGSRIAIGADSVFTYDVILQCTSSITIGEHCMFGQAGLVVDGNHRFRDLELPMLRQGYDLRPVVIADHVTTTTKCTIIADIGERAFVGANSVVSVEIPAFCVAVGAPARPVEYFGPAGQGPAGVPERTSAASPGDGETAPSAAAARSQASRK
jgi:acetyltransferase-like isoleucine patch superfamily enzyme